MPENFGDSLRKVRENLKLSQSDLANRSGLQPSAISHFETGNRSPSFENLKRLSEALGISIDYLLGRSTQLGTVTPVAEQIFRDFSKMTANDQESLAKMASFLAEKNMTDKGTSSK